MLLLIAVLFNLKFLALYFFVVFYLCSYHNLYTIAHRVEPETYI